MLRPQTLTFDPKTIQFAFVPLLTVVQWKCNHANHRSNIADRQTKKTDEHMKNAGRRNGVFSSTKWRKTHKNN